jgi:hypothetical protein
VNWDFIHFCFVRRCDDEMTKRIKNCLQNFLVSYFLILSWKKLMYIEIFKITSLKRNGGTGNESRDGLALKLTLMRYDDKVFFLYFFLLR